MVEIELDESGVIRVDEDMYAAGIADEPEIESRF